MIRRHGTLLRVTLAVADGLAALSVMAVLSLFRFGDSWPEQWTRVLEDWPVAASLVAIGWIGALWSQGLYSLRSRWSFRGHAKAIVRAGLIIALSTFALLFLLKMNDVSRAFLLALLPALALSALASRAAIHWLLTVARRRGRNSRFVVIIGSGQTARHTGHELEGHPALGLRIVGYVNDEPASEVDWPFLGHIAELSEVLHGQVVDEVAICLDTADWELIQSIVELCKAEGKTVRVPLAGAVISGAGTHVEDLAGLPVLSIVQGPDRQLALAAKRLVDVTVASVAAVVLSPLVALISLAILLTNGRPVLFRQERVGLHGRRFQLLKFRTMVPGAEDRMDELRRLNEIEGPAFKLTRDPRVTRLGGWLRRTSLDELPQMWNVLRGDMSLIGPRPPLPAEVSKYDAWHRRRLSMKPGITGLWQVGHRREPKFDRWVERDLEYIDRWSLRLDAQIALRTIPRMLRADGR